MQNQELTGWFELSEQKPWVDGVYEVQRHEYGSSGQFSLFKSGRFHEVGWNNPCAAIRYAEAFGVGDGDDVVRWRGLSSDPNDKPKSKSSGNPKVTRYVVIDKNRFGEFKGALAVFENVDLAREYANMARIPVRIQKIRFRSPE